MLGAGFVTRPTLDILSEAKLSVTVGMHEIAFLISPFHFCEVWKSKSLFR